MHTFKEVDRKCTISFFLESDLHRYKYPESSFLLIKWRNKVTFKTLFGCVVIFWIVDISYEPFFKEGHWMKNSILVSYKFSLRRPFSYNRRFAEWPLKEDFAMFDKILTLFYPICVILSKLYNRTVLGHDYNC